MKHIDLRELRDRIGSIPDEEGVSPVTRRFLEQVERELTESRLLRTVQQ